MKEILKNFRLSGEIKSLSPYGEGHINNTYLVVVNDCDTEKKYILQKIAKIFKDIPALMKNIELVTEFNRTKIKARGGNPDRESLTIIKSNDNKPYYFDGIDYYRVYIFIDNATSFQRVEKAEHFYESAVAFGNFINLLNEFDASLLTESLPNFHNTRVRFNNFLKAVESDEFKRATSVKAEIDFVKKREKYSDILTGLLIRKEMPLRVTHNDTKLNNVMIDDVTGKGIAVIDLDTIMPGSLCYDFGDSIRFGCNPFSEDEKDLKKVIFNKEYFTQFAKGFLFALKDSITNIEKENLVNGALIMTYECGMRFLTDYLMGDVYFHTRYDGQNLDRARTQFKLVEDIENSYNELNEIIKTF